MKKLLFILAVLAFVACSDNAYDTYIPAQPNEQEDETQNQQNEVPDQPEDENKESEYGDCWDNLPPPTPEYWCTVSGRVVDINGKPIQGIHVTAPNMYTRVDTTNEKGEFSWSCGWEEERYPWKDGGNPSFSVLFNATGELHLRYEEKTVTYLFTDRHRVDIRPEIEFEYLIDDADVVLEFNDKYFQF